MKTKNLLYCTSAITLSLTLNLAVFLPACDSKQEEGGDTATDDDDDDDSAADSKDSSDDDDDDDSKESSDESDESGEEDSPDPTPSSDDDDDDDESSEPTSDFEMEGECRYYGEGVYKDDKYEGTIDYVLIADQGNGEDLCRVRFDIKTVEKSKRECVADECYWATVVALSNPEVIEDVDGKCAESDRKLSDDQIKALLDKPMDFAVGEEPTGHGKIILDYSESAERWEQVCYTEWVEDTGAVEYEFIEGTCNY